MSEKIKAIRGNLQRCEEVVTWLEEHGAKDAKHQVDGSCEYLLYFVDPNGDAQCIDKESEYLFDVEELPRWRAEKGKTYYIVTELCNVRSNLDDYTPYDDWHHELGNYFHTREEAEEMSKQIYDLFMQRQ